MKHAYKRNGKIPSVTRYLNEIGEYSVLSREEEITLTQQVRHGKHEAFEKLIKANLRFVISIAKEYRGQGLPLEDLISEGNVGLLKAAQKYDETRGYKFISYAVWWIRQSILQALGDQARIVRLPMNRIAELNKAGRTIREMEIKNGRKISVPEMINRLGRSNYEVAHMFKTSASHRSLDEPLNEDGGTLLDLIESDPSSAPDKSLIQESLQKELELALESLSDREAEMIRLYFGLGQEYPATLEEIGRKYHISRERVRQIKDHALNQLRRRRRLEALRKYLG